jgi:hypothetical protein
MPSLDRLYFFHPILLYNMTTIFFNDSYLLLPSFAILMLALLLIEPVPLRPLWKAIPAVVIIVIFCLINRNEMLKHKDSALYFEATYQGTPSCYNQFYYAHSLWYHHQNEQALLVSKAYLKSAPLTVLYLTTMGEKPGITFYYDKNLIVLENMSYSIR